MARSTPMVWLINFLTRDCQAVALSEKARIRFSLPFESQRMGNCYGLRAGPSHSLWNPLGLIMTPLNFTSPIAMLLLILMGPITKVPKRVWVARTVKHVIEL
ncbi:hypothetical protein CLU79DRAFT_733627 [Phycomyces nitens]|nr:hypothetical protein CLU79DRAFT_733627 [Phycomyces nitens]